MCSCRPAARRSRKGCFCLAAETCPVVFIERFVEEALREADSDADDDDDEEDAKEADEVAASGG